MATAPSLPARVGAFAFRDDEVTRILSSLGERAHERASKGESGSTRSREPKKYQSGGLSKKVKKVDSTKLSSTNLLGSVFLNRSVALGSQKRPFPLRSARAVSSLRGAFSRFLLQPLGLRDGSAPSWCVRKR